MAERVVLKAAVTGAALLGIAVGGHALLAGGPAPAAAAPPIVTGTAPVARTDVEETTQVNGTLTYDGSFTVQAAGTGRLTRLPRVGSVVRRGRAVFEADGRRVPLLYGSRPAWRPFALGMTNGADVRQLERNLKALGYGGFTVDSHFDLGTYWAVRSWQRHLRLPVTGSLPIGSVVFLPGPLRVTGHDAAQGAPASGQILHGSGLTPVVSIQLDPASAPDVRRGDRVTVTLPDGRTRRGRVAEVSGVAVTSPGGQGGQGQQEQSSVPATIRLGGRPPRLLDQALVQVVLTTERRRGVLAVPTVALLARPGGSFAVVTVSSGGRRTTAPVETGLFDEIAGVVEVTGVPEGALVEVPAQ
ncbi:peptidoglycan-binding protein [Microbispora sp. NPDC049125]|uniref:peptidoglycan-binding protein n=1 Tax=Microbispora sp. NPDC049125 TaxID=3154929 RepID=UPI0034664652